MIFLLKTRSSHGYRDTVTGFVIRARNEDQARLLATFRAGDEGGAFWLNKALSSCAVVQDPDGAPPEVILRDSFEG